MRTKRPWCLRVGTGLGLVIGLLGCDGTVVKSPAASGRWPNVLLVTLDTTRADRLGCYGHAAANTPHLDQLARRGVLFERALTVAPITLPSHASLMTGQLPPVHGVRDNGIHCLPESHTTLAEHFQRAGYATGAFVSAVVLQASFGLDQGFAEYDDLMDSSRAGVLEPVERIAGKTVDAAMAWVQMQSQPWFLWLHLFDPHFPYEAPPSPNSPADPYDAEIAYMDQELGRLLQALGADVDQTLMVVTADHGEGLGEHREATHGLFLYDSTMRVPLIVAGPGVEAGQRVAGQVSLVDIQPTLLELIFGEASNEVQGQSLAQALTGAAATVDHQCYLETYLPMLSYGLSPMLGWSDGDYKYLQSPKPELFELRQDPGETKNRIGDEPQVLQKGLTQIERWTALSDAAPEATALDPELQVQLSQLGYLHGGSSEFAGADPKDAIGWVEGQAYALHLIQTKQYEKAMSILERVLEQAPANATARAYLGQAYFGAQQWAKSADHFREALALRSDLAYAEYYLGQCCSKLGDPQQALAAFDRLIQRFPTMGKAYLAASQVCYEQSDYGKAQQYLERALTEIPADDYSRETIATNLRHLINQNR